MICTFVVRVITVSSHFYSDVITSWSGLCDDEIDSGSGKNDTFEFERYILD